MFEFISINLTCRYNPKLTKERVEDLFYNIISTSVKTSYV